jgi:hypothetical protein
VREAEPRAVIVIVGANDPTPDMRLEVRCSACGVVIAREEIDVRHPIDGGALGAQHAAAWRAHRC